MNNPGARLPYSKIEQYGILIEGLPEGKILKHPSSYGAQTLKAILAKKDSRYVTMCTKYCYFKDMLTFSFKSVNHTLVW